MRDPQILNNSLFKQRKLYRSGNKALRFLVFYVIGKKEKQKKIKVYSVNLESLFHFNTC